VLNDLLIALHALAGVVCFIAGVLSLGLSTARSWRFCVYLASLGALLLFMAAAIAVDWAGLDAAARLTYAGLSALGLYMLWRAGHAGIRLRTHGHNWRPSYVDDIGFTLISLFDGFVIVSAIDMGAPGWLVALIAVAGVAAGVLAMRTVKARLGAEPAYPDRGS
jgi:hypothetical protein